MKTEELIAGLSLKAGGVRDGAIVQSTWMALGLGLAVSAMIFAMGYGFRDHIGAALHEPMTLAKTLLPLAIGLAALSLTLRAARPGTRPGKMAAAFPLLLLTAVGLLFWNVITTPAGGRMALFVGHSIPVCLPSIILLSTPMFGLLMRALRQGAPEHPARCGALAGLAAAGFAAALYSLFCTEDAPLFYVSWYGTAIGIVTLIGVLAGTRLLRW